MDRYIEVFGEAQFLETASRFIAEVTVEVRAAKDETALREVAELWAEALSVLRDAGIKDEEIIEGGTDFHRPWYWKKQVGQSASRKIILKATDFGRLNSALERLEPLQSGNKERKSIAISMRQPEFDSPVEDRASALALAYDDAAAKARTLAQAMNYKLGGAIHVEEGGSSKRNSGFSGDQDWGGDSSRFDYTLVARGGGAAAEPAPELQTPTRTIFVRCRVRFAVSDK